MEASDSEDERLLRPLIVNQVGDGSTSLWGKPLDRTKTGAWKAAPFIYVLIFADTISVLGIAGNLSVYAFGTLHLTIAESANTVTNFMGLTYLLPVIGGFLADSYFGRFWIISFSTLSTFTGLVILALSATLPSLQPPSCTPSEESPVCPKASWYVLSWFYAALCLISVGSAGVKPCMLSLGQDQFDETDPDETRQGSNFFTAYFVVLNIFSIFCVTILFYIQSSVSFPWGYGTLAVLYLVSISVFFLGSKYFRHRKPTGSTLTRAAQVLVAATRNYNQPIPENALDLYELSDKSSVEGIRKIVHTDKLRLLDKAAIIKVESVSKWEMCTVTQVEELKAIIQIAPIWLCLVLVFTLYAQVMGLGVQQAATLDRHLGLHFTIPPGSAAVVLMLSGVAFIAVYQYLLIPPLQKITGHPQGLSPLRKIGISLFFAVIAMAIAAQVEDMRVHTIEDHPEQTSGGEVPMSIWWLVPQFILLGWVEVLLGIAQLHLLYREAPEGMRSVAVSLTFATIAVGYFVSSALVSTVNEYTKSTGGWLAEEFNKGGLRKYYYLLSSLMAIDLLIFVFFANGYTYKTLQSEKSKDGEASLV